MGRRTNHSYAVGDRLTKLEGGTTTTYTYDSANELTTEVTPTQTTTCSFDNNGNTTLKNAAGSLTTYTWDGEDRMTKLEQPTSPAVMTFTYDANSFRRTLHDGTSLTKFLNDWVTGMPGIDPVLIETDASDSTIVTYTPALLHGLLSLTRHPSLVTHWYHYEAIGSTRQLTDASQVVTDTYTYEAFGKEVVTSGATVNMLRYVGQLNYYTDGKSGLVLLGVRVYDDKSGRFLSQDLLREGVNWYCYVFNDPANAVDPTGNGITDVFFCDKSTAGTGADCCYNLVTSPYHPAATLVSCPPKNTAKCQKCASTEKLGSVTAYCQQVYAWTKAEPGILITQLACINKYLKSAKANAYKHCPEGADKCVHCLASCYLAKNCGTGAAKYAAWCKEMNDLTDCNKSSHFEMADWVADEVGFNAGKSKATCIESCGKYGAKP